MRVRLSKTGPEHFPAVARSKGTFLRAATPLFWSVRGLSVGELHGWTRPGEAWHIEGDRFGVLSGEQAPTVLPPKVLRDGIFFKHVVNEAENVFRIHRRSWGLLPRGREVIIDDSTGSRWLLRAAFAGVRVLRGDGTRIGSFHYWGAFLNRDTHPLDVAAFLGTLLNNAQNHALGWIFGPLRFSLPTAEGF